MERKEGHHPTVWEMVILGKALAVGVSLWERLILSGDANFKLDAHCRFTARKSLSLLAWVQASEAQALAH